MIGYAHGQSSWLTFGGLLVRALYGHLAIHPAASETYLVLGEPVELEDAEGILLDSITDYDGLPFHAFGHVTPMQRGCNAQPVTSAYSSERRH